MSESLGQAVEFLAAGDWKKAHEIVQKDKSTLSSWIHGIVHIVEGGDVRHSEELTALVRGRWEQRFGLVGVG